MSDAPAFDFKLARLVHIAEAPGILYASCFDAAKGDFYGGGADGCLYRVNTRPEKPFGEKDSPEKSTAEKLWRLHENYVAALAWLSGTQPGTIISAGYDRRLVWTNSDSGEQLREVTAHDSWLRDLAILPESGKVATVGDDMLLKIWDLTGALVHRCEAHAQETPEGYANALYAVAASPDEKLLATADRCGEVCLWEVATGKLQQRFQAATFYTFDAVARARSIGGIRSLCFLGDANQLALGGIGQVSNVDGFVGPCRWELWDLAANKRTAIGTDKHQAVLNHLQYLPNEKLLIGAGGGDGGPLLAAWNPPAEAPLNKAKPKSHIQHFVCDASSRQLFAAGHQGLQIWAFTAAPATAEKK